MFVFDLFDDKDKKKKSKQKNIQNKGDIYYQTNDPYVRAGLDRAHREHPTAKSDTEAMIGHVARQDELIRNQARMLKQQELENDKQEKQINDLVKSTQEKEKRFQDLTDLVKDQGLTPQQGAEMAKELEKDATGTLTPQQIAVPQKTTAPAAKSQTKLKVVPVPTAQQPQIAEPARPQPGASVQQVAKYNKEKEQFDQMVKQLGQSSQTKAASPEPAQQELPIPSNVQQMPMSAATQKRLAALSGLGMPANSDTFKQVANLEEAFSPGDIEAIKQHNAKSFRDAYAFSQSTKLYFGDGRWEDLTFPEIEQMVSAISTDYTEQTRPQVWQQLFTDHNYFLAFKKQHLSQLPLQFDEGDVIRLTNSPKTPEDVKAYNRAVEIMQAAKNPNVPTEKIDQLKQFLIKDFNARIQQAPDGSFYLNRNGIKSPLPDPNKVNEEPHDGKNAWNDGQSQWSSENNLISSGNNPIGFREEATQDKTGATMYQAKEKFLVRHNGKDVAFFSTVEQATQAAKELQKDLKGVATVHRVMREQDMAEGWSDAIVARRTGRARTPYSVYIKGKKWKDFENDDHARAVMDKLKAKFKEEGRDPNTITIAPTDIPEGVVESNMSDIDIMRQDLELMSDQQFLRAYKISKEKFKQDYDYLLRPAAPQDTPMANPKFRDAQNRGFFESKNYWKKLQEERRRKAYSYLNELTDVLKDIK